MKKLLKNESLASIATLLIAIIIIVIPLAIITTEIVNKAGNAYAFLDHNYFTALSESVSNKFGFDVNFDSEIRSLFNSAISFIIKNSLSFVGSVTEVILGMFIMFIGMFYLFKNGHKVNQVINNYLPLKKQYKEDLIVEVKDVTHAVVYSEILISIVQGTLTGLSFLIFGLPDPIFWGFIATILSFLPVVGPPMVWIPAGAIRLLSGDVGTAIGIFLFNGLITMNIDNLMRPRIVSKRSRLHPFITLVGIVGGLKLFGFIGIILGPMIIALFTVLLRYFNKEF